MTVLEEVGLDEASAGARLMRAWDDALGPDLAPHCRPEDLHRATSTRFRDEREVALPPRQARVALRPDALEEQLSQRHLPRPQRRVRAQKREREEATTKAVNADASGTAHHWKIYRLS